MRKTAPVFTKNGEASLTVPELERLTQGWVLDGEIRQLTKRTLEERRRFVGKLLWFFRYQEYPTCGTHELRSLLAYVARGDKNGRWGNPQRTEPVKPRTVQLWFEVLQAFFNWAIEEGALESSPMGTLRAPIVRADQIQPFTPDQVTALLAAARKTNHPRRDEAILLFLLDTGARASELCSLRVSDLDLGGRRCTLQGKGGKTRPVFLGKEATKALWSYLKEEGGRDDDDPLFMSDRGLTEGRALTRSGLFQLIARLGKAARIEATRCSPHTWRHTMAIEFLRAGGQEFTLMQILGHTSLVMTRRYVALAQADVQAQHAQFSPADRLRRR